MVLLTLGVGLSGLQYAGFVVNYLDVAPAFAGPIVGVGNTISCIAGILSPNIMGYFTTQAIIDLPSPQSRSFRGLGKSGSWYSG